jgi:hypothetical protein
MVKLTNAEIDMLFHRSSNPSIVSGEMEGAGVGIPLKLKRPYKIKAGNINTQDLIPSVGVGVGTSNSNENRDPVKRKPRQRLLKRDQKINGVMDGAGFKEFSEGFKKGFKNTIKTVAPIVMDIGSTVVPQAKPLRQAVKQITGLGYNTNYNEARQDDGTQGKQSLKKELGIGAGSKPKWIDFISEIRKIAPKLKFSEALKIGSAMKKDKKDKLSDITQQSVATYARQLGLTK